MPRIPQLERQVSEPEVRPQYSSVRPPQRQSSGLGEGLQRLGGAIQQTTQVLGGIYQQQKEEADSTRADAADAEYGAAINEVLYNKDNGFLNKQGQQGLNDSPADEALRKAQAKIAAGLANDEQRRKFLLRSSTRYDHARTLMHRHVSEQFGRVQADVAEGSVKLALDTVAAQYNDNAAVESAIGKVLASPEGEPGPLRRHLLKQGLPPEKMAAIESEFVAKARAAQLDVYIQRGDGEGAKALFRHVEKQLGAAAPKYERAINELANAAENDVITSGIINDSTDPGYGWLDPAKAMARVEQLPVGPKREEIRKLVEHRVAKAEELKRKAGEAKFDEALSVYYDTGKTLHSRRMAPIRAWLLDPKNGAAELWDKLERADTREKNETRGDRDRADQQAVIAFLAKPIREQAAANINKEFADRASSEALNIMRRHQNDATERLRRGEIVDAPSFEKAVRDAALQTQTLKGSKARQNEFLAHMNSWRLRYIDKQKEEPTLSEIQAEMAKQLEFGDETGGGLSGNRFRFQAEREGVPFVPFEPKEQLYPGNRERKPEAKRDGLTDDIRRRLIEDYQKTRSGTPTEAQIQKAYELKKARGDFEL